MKSDALRIAQMKHREVMIQATRDVIIAYEPLVTIVGAAAALGYLENNKIGPNRYQLISTNQKRVLLAGVIAVEVARSGLIGQVGGAVGEIGGVVKDIGGVITPMLAAGGM
jgi:hypothetical protein